MALEAGNWKHQRNIQDEQGIHFTVLLSNGGIAERTIKPEAIQLPVRRKSTAQSREMAVLTQAAQRLLDVEGGEKALLHPVAIRRVSVGRRSGIIREKEAGWFYFSEYDIQGQPHTSRFAQAPSISMYGLPKAITPPDVDVHFSVGAGRTGIYTTPFHEGLDLYVPKIRSVQTPGVRRHAA